jgi:hypothetical protein
MPGKDDKDIEEAKKAAPKAPASTEGTKKSSSTAASSSSGPGNVIVVCRFRPLNQNELNHGGSNV